MAALILGTLGGRESSPLERAEGVVLPYFQLDLIKVQFQLQCKLSEIFWIGIAIYLSVYCFINLQRAFGIIFLNYN